MGVCHQHRSHRLALPVYVLHLSPSVYDSRDNFLRYGCAPLIGTGVIPIEKHPSGRCVRVV
jgi:hypothetical protein